MRCADPVLVYNTAKGGRQFRHFSLASPVFKQMHQLVFNCGKCIFCRKKKAFELAARCVLHSSLYPKNCFLTLTYDEKKEGYHNNFNYKDIQDFKKKLRSYVTRNFQKRIEVFNVHEYGKNGKKHWHLIVFNHDFEDKTVHTFSKGLPLYTSKKLDSLWGHGFSTIGDVSEGSAMYQAQYMEKDFKHNYRGTSKASHSKHAGIGKPYFLKHYSQILRLGYIPFSGRKMPVPRYFEKIAHKHFCHFYDTANFVDTKDRKALYRPFKEGEAIKEMADLYLGYLDQKQSKILDLEKEWEAVISQHLTLKESPDFLKASENVLHDLRNKNHHEQF